MNLPALVQTGLLVLGLIDMADGSLRTLDTSTFLFSDEYSLANYRRAFSESLFFTVASRSLFGSLIVTVVTLIFVGGVVALHETLAAYTKNGAWVEFMEDRKGVLKPGYLADIVVLSADVETADFGDLAKIRPVTTICDGRITYQA